MKRRVGTGRGRSFAAVAAVGVIGAGLTGASAIAQDRIGNTAIARNQVSQVSAAKTAPIQLGDDVFTNENVRTGDDSAAKFVFSDQTNLAVGPVSNVKLDRFVYKGDTTYSKAAVNFAAGAFRFTTGASEKKAYELKTSTATIGVRGTIFDINVVNGVTTVTLVEGDIAICPRALYDGDPRKLSKAQLKKYHCVELDKAGQTAKVTSRTASLSSAPFNFASNFCSGDSALCSASISTALNASSPARCYAHPDE